jgi:hypothetical protein
MARNERRKTVMDDSEVLRIENEVASLERQIEHLQRRLETAGRREEGFILPCLRDLHARSSRLQKKVVDNVAQEVANLQRALQMIEEKERIQQLLQEANKK